MDHPGWFDLSNTNPRDAGWVAGFLPFSSWAWQVGGQCQRIQRQIRLHLPWSYCSAVGWMSIILSILCRPPRVIYYIINIHIYILVHETKLNVCSLIWIHEFLGSLASSSNHWRTCKFASHSDVSTMSFTDRSSNQVQPLQSPWIPVHPLSLDLNPSSIFICYGIQLPILA